MPTDRPRLLGLALDERHGREVAVVERVDRPARLLAVSLAQLAEEFVPVEAPATSGPAGMPVIEDNGSPD